MTLVLYQHPLASFAQKALVALYELDLEFESRLVENEDSRAELTSVWPLAKIPVLVDESAGITLPESTSIIEYLDGLAPGGPTLVPADPAAALQMRLWDRFHDQYIAAPMQKIVTDNLRPAGRSDPEGVAEARRTLDTAYGVLDAHLADHEWTAGPTFGLADCGAGPALFYARIVHRWDEQAHANIARYYRALVERSALARVIDEARPYREVFPLPWPDDADER
jgi:glutathione S-transferase